MAASRDPLRGQDLPPGSASPRTYYSSAPATAPKRDKRARNAIIILLLIPIALKGVRYRPVGADALLRRNLLIWGLGGVIVPFVGIKLIDLVLVGLRLLS